MLPTITFWPYSQGAERTKVHVYLPYRGAISFYVYIVALSLIVRSLNGKNWQDLYKADKVSISFPATPKSNWNVFGGVMKIFAKFILPGGENDRFWNNGSGCLFMFYSIIVFNNKVLGYFSTTWTWQPINGHKKFPVWCSHIKYHWLTEKHCQPLTYHLTVVTPP